MAYVDTSVLVAAYAPADPIHKQSRKFLASNRPNKVISPLTFEELSSVLARTEEDMLLPPPLQKEPLGRRTRAVVEYIIRDSGLTLASELGSSRIRIGNRSLNIPLEYTKAASLAPLLKLRAMDLLHLAYAHLTGKLQFSITSFITGDGAIISKAQDIRKTLEIAVRHPNDTT